MTFILISLLTSCTNFTSNYPAKIQEPALSEPFHEIVGKMESTSKRDELAKIALKNTEQGNIQAKTYLGLMYLQGRGIEQSSKEAFFWFYQAANQGDAKAQFQLGSIYENGKGVAINQVKQ